MSEVLFSQGEKIGALKDYRSLGIGILGKQSHYAKRGEALTAAALADKTEHLGLFDEKIQSADDIYGGSRRLKEDTEIPYLKEGHCSYFSSFFRSLR